MDDFQCSYPHRADHPCLCCLAIHSVELMDREPESSPNTTKSDKPALGYVLVPPGAATGVEYRNCKRRVFFGCAIVLVRDHSLLSARGASYEVRPIIRQVSLGRACRCVEPPVHMRICGTNTGHIVDGFGQRPLTRRTPHEGMVYGHVRLGCCRAGGLDRHLGIDNASLPDPLLRTPATRTRSGPPNVSSEPKYSGKDE